MSATEWIPNLSSTPGPAPVNPLAGGRVRTPAVAPVADPRDGVEASRSTPVAPQGTPLASVPSSSQWLAAIDAILSTAGAIRGEVGELGDVEFPIGRVRDRLHLRFPLTALHHQGLARTASAAAAQAAGNAAAPAADTFARTVGGMVGGGFALSGDDVQALVQWVLREAYLEGTQDLRFYAEKVKFFNMQKKAIREQLARWRKLQTEFAGLSEEDKAKTGLDGTTTAVAGGEDGEGIVDGGPPVVTSAEQRARDYPDGNILVAEFTGFAIGGGRTGLEDYIIRDSGARERLLQAIPYMTTAELRQVLGALGGTDMKLADELGNIWSEIVEAMRPDQMFELAANPTIADFGFFRVDVFRGQLGNVFNARLRATRARIEAELGQSFGNDWARLANAYRQHRREQLVAAEREAYGAADESTRAAIQTLREANPDAAITTEQMVALIRDATGDADGQAAGIEYDDLAAFVEEHRDRLTPGALAAWDAYTSVVMDQRAQGQSGIPVGTWEEMISSLEQMAVEHAEQDAALLAGPGEEEIEEDVTVEADALFGDIDGDPSDGSIDDVMLNDAAPPYLVASGEKIETVAQLETAIKNLEEKLSAVGDDAQLANVDLQNMLQKQQQLIQMLSNVGKTLHDTAMAVIRKIGS